MHTFVVCAVFKNESHIMEEWIKHYLKRGIEHFYLVNDFSTDNFEEILKGYPVSLYHNDIISKDVGRQTRIYDKYFKNISSKWVAILDLDEFLWSPETMFITDCFDECSQIKVEWLHFGSSSHITQPDSVVNNFTKRAKFSRDKPYYSFKTIYQPKYLSNFGIHGHTVTGKTITSESLFINHYPIQSFNFFMTIKATRGDLDNWFDNTGRKRDKGYFISQDINEIEDTRLLIQNNLI